MSEKTNLWGELRRSIGIGTFAEKITMRIDILTVVPELLESPFNYSILKRAKDKGLAEIFIHNIREWQALFALVSSHRILELDYETKAL